VPGSASQLNVKLPTGTHVFYDSVFSLAPTPARPAKRLKGAVIPGGLTCFIDYVIGFRDLTDHCMPTVGAQGHDLNLTDD
jgi:hypothetical protein